jgi:hypothetical protein
MTQSYPPGQPYPPPPPWDPLISPDYAGWWQRTSTLISTAWRPLLILHGAGALLWFVVLAAISVLTTVRNHVYLTSDGGFDTLGAVVPALAGVGLGVLILVAASLLINLGTVYLIVAAATGGPLTWQAALRTVARRALPLLGWGLLVGVSIVLGLVACVLPGLYLVAVFTPLAPVVAAERGNAYTRCFRLFHGAVGTALPRAATIFGITVLVGGVAGTPLRAVQTFAGSTAILVAGSLVGVLIQVVVSAAAGLVTAALATTAYADVRARREPVNAVVIAHGVAGR